MRVGTPATFAVILCLGTTVLEATYLERPLWVADKGRQQSLTQGNEDTRPSQLYAVNEPSWIVPEPYGNGAASPEWVDKQRIQPNQDSPNAAQKVRGERPAYDSYGQNQAYEPDAAYEYQTMYQEQASQSAWMNQQQQQQQQQQQVEYKKPYPAQEPPKQQVRPEPEYYPTYGGQQQGWNREPENVPLNSYQTQFQTQEELYQPNRMDGYKPRPDTDTKVSLNKPKPERKPEPVSPNTAPVRPQEVQQNYKPSPARPELYQPGPVYVEPEYQAPYFGQQTFPSITEPDQYQRQKPTDKQPSYQPLKPVPESNKVKKPTPQENQFEQAPPANMGYYPYQPQAGDYYPYQQNPPAGLQASVQKAPENWIGEQGMSVYQKPSIQGSSYDRELVIETPKPQVNRNPVEPPRTEQRPNRPLVQKQPEQPPNYQPNLMPSTGWEAPYKPVQPAPVMPKPKPQQQRPPQQRQPETYYWDNGDDEEEAAVKYEKPITRFDTRCPLEDNPAKPVHFPSLTSCLKFQKCFNGIAYEMSCPTGLQFDSKSNRCDYPARARCSM